MISTNRSNRRQLRCPIDETADDFVIGNSTQEKETENDKYTQIIFWNESEHIDYSDKHIGS